MGAGGRVLLPKLDRVDATARAAHRREANDRVLIRPTLSGSGMPLRCCTTPRRTRSVAPRSPRAAARRLQRSRPLLSASILAYLSEEQIRSSTRPLGAAIQ